MSSRDVERDILASFRSKLGPRSSVSDEPVSEFEPFVVLPKKTISTGAPRTTRANRVAIEQFRNLANNLMQPLFRFASMVASECPKGTTAEQLLGLISEKQYNKWLLYGTSKETMSDEEVMEQLNKLRLGTRLKTSIQRALRAKRGATLSEQRKEWIKKRMLGEQIGLMYSSDFVGSLNRCATMIRSFPSLRRATVAGLIYTDSDTRSHFASLCAAHYNLRPESETGMGPYRARWKQNQLQTQLNRAVLVFRNGTVDADGSVHVNRARISSRFMDVAEEEEDVTTASIIL